ncbi:hypothetical protein, partial [Planktothrix agardhii]
MKFLVDTCGWLEWLTDGVLADEFAPYLNDSDNLIIPTSIQYELHKWICRERDVVLAMEIIRKRWESGNSVSSDLRGNATQGNLFPLKYQKM